MEFQYLHYVILYLHRLTKYHHIQFQLLYNPCNHYNNELIFGHVITEFNNGIGWIPIDVTLKSEPICLANVMLKQSGATYAISGIYPNYDNYRLEVYLTEQITGKMYTSYLIIRTDI